MTGPTRTSGEEGMALIIALGVLVLVGLLAAVGIETAVRTSRVTRSDTVQKAALAAADAGLAVATYRLNMLAPDGAHCVTTIVTAASGSLCPVDGPDTLGNGASFQFQVTPVLSGGNCAGQTMTNTLQSVAVRCISAIGTASGVSVRTQAQVDSFAAQPFFPEPGIIGLNKVAVAQNATVNSVAATNGVLALSNNSTVNGVVLGLGGSISGCNNNCPYGVSVTLPNRIGLAAVPVGTSPTINSDARITNGRATPAVTPYDTTSGATWTAATRTISFANNGSSITLGGGLYNFCNFTTGNKTVINVANGVKAVIIIDSPTDPNSGCPAGSGNLSLGNNVTFNDFNAVPAATDLQFYVYGNGTSIPWGNGTTTYASLFAPNSIVDLNNVGSFVGAIAAIQVNINNVGTYTYDPSTASLQASSQGLYYRSAWQQCPAAATVSGDLGSGC
jgi:Tfp pilus assembly protein PilX